MVPTDDEVRGKGRRRMHHAQGTTVIGSYNFGLVALSVIIAIISSSVALTLASRLRTATAQERFRWTLGGACAMGFGIWAMHFTGMLAYDLGMPVRYDLPTVVVSLVAAIGAAAVALNVIYRPGITRLRLVLGGTLMGAGIGVMHYTGMYAMRMEAHTQYNPRIFLLSVVVAVVVATMALWFAAQTMRDDVTSGGDLFAAAILMGLGVASMHYTAMVAASFEVRDAMVGSSAFALDLSRLWVGAIIFVTLLILGFGLRIGRGVSDQRALTVSSGASGD
jgi:NO-binding membrane sensor protein with MHYT domain